MRQLEQFTDCQMVCAATRTFALLGLSLTILFFGPIPATAVLITRFVFAQNVTDTRPRNTTRRKQPRRSGNVTSIPASAPRARPFPDRKPRSGNAKWMGV